MRDVIKCPRCRQLANQLGHLLERNSKFRILLRESRREHVKSCGPALGPNTFGPCDCGADEWNARIGEALGENSPNV